MHRYLRAIGFSKKTRKEIQDIVMDCIRKADKRSYTLVEDETMAAEFSREYADSMGITVSGNFDEEDKFHLEYYFPYLDGSGVTSYEDISVEKHASEDSFAGVCDDVKVGISIIFYLRNKIPYLNAQNSGKLPIRGTSVTFSGLSIRGSVLLPLNRPEEDENSIKQKDPMERAKLLAAAKNGDEEAIETLTIEDMDIYNSLSKRIKNEDVYSIVDTSFMPYGVECDQYSIIGDIVAYRLVTNHITEEKIYILTILCNDLTFDVAINIIDLFGEPEVGRRFKGVIWLQGNINYPEDIGSFS
ncbi:MAG: DUF3881 family protein [Lachnospiraceae bacterium]|nr:DUF3881 family protein [Lachnospiraceae bacterium]